MITHISEVGLDEASNTYVVDDIFTLDTTLEFPELKWTGRTPKLAAELGWKGLADQVKLTKKIMKGS